MAHVHLRAPWQLPESEVTPEEVYLGRRAFLRQLAAAGGAAFGGTVWGGVGLGGAAGLLGCGGESRGAVAQEAGPLGHVPPAPTASLYPDAKRDPRFVPGARHGHVTPERIVAAYNNFYEFTTDKEAVWRFVDPFEARPWEVEVTGLVERPLRVDLTELERGFPLEERIYRLRCVEAWSVVVPWIGFPLRSLLEKVRPRSSARYVRFVSFLRPDQAVGQKKQTWYPWPYFEALRMDEALNELAFLVTGMYGHPLQKQNGAPLRLAVPWKYGYKSIKSIVRIELAAERPPTFWNTLVPAEYGFLSNVDPEVPHPRWSQATEEVVETGERVPTLPYNGYGEWVAGLYG
ncbi:MAG: protein-methionine-sulfoxide reductase catalytic subunit MsrP [Gemmatimonadota bacterium]